MWRLKNAALSDYNIIGTVSIHPKRDGLIVIV